MMRKRIIAVLLCLMLTESIAIAQDKEESVLDAPPPPSPIVEEAQQYDDISFLNAVVEGGENAEISNVDALEISYSEFLKLLDKKVILTAEVSSFGQWVYFSSKENENYKVRVAQSHDLADRLAAAGAEVRFVPQLPRVSEYQPPSFWLMIGYGFFQALPWVLGIVLIGFLLIRGSAQRQKNFQAMMDAEKARSETFFERLEKLLTEKKDLDG